MDRGSRPHSPSSTLILPYPYASLHLLRAITPFTVDFSSLPMDYASLLSLSLSLLVSITIDRNFENFLNRSDSPPLIMHPILYLSLFPEKRRKITSLLDNSIHYPPILPSIPFSITLFIHRFRPSINHLQYFSTLFLFTPQHFHSLDFSVPIDGAHRNLIPYSPTLTSLTLLPPLPSTLQSTTIDLLRERSRKSISRTKTKTRKGKRR